jgi:hypothetical protein
MIGDPAELGKRVARRFIVRGVRPSVRELIVQMGVEVKERPAPPPAQPGLRSEYQQKPPSITLYRDPIDLLSAAVHANQRFDMLACNLDDVHIAHELFHHLEAGQRFGPLRDDEVEAAAQAFTETLLELAFHPDELADFAI